MSGSRSLLKVFNGTGVLPPPAGGPMPVQQQVAAVQPLMQPAQPSVIYVQQPPPPQYVAQPQPQQATVAPDLLQAMVAEQVAKATAATLKPAGEAPPPGKSALADRFADMESRWARMETENLRLRLVAAAKQQGLQFHEEFVTGNNATEIEASIRLAVKRTESMTAEAEQRVLARYARQQQQPPQPQQQVMVGFSSAPAYPQPQYPSVPQFRAPTEPVQAPRNAGFTPQQVEYLTSPAALANGDYEKYRGALMGALQQVGGQAQTMQHPQPTGMMPWQGPAAPVMAVPPGYAAPAGQQPAYPQPPPGYAPQQQPVYGPAPQQQMPYYPQQQPSPQYAQGGQLPGGLQVASQQATDQHFGHLLQAAVQNGSVPSDPQQFMNGLMGSLPSQRGLLS